MKQEHIDIIKSGNFSIITWDNEQYSVYEGHQTVESVNDKDLEPFLEYDCECEGYLPQIVADLVSILNGTSESI